MLHRFLEVQSTKKSMAGSFVGITYNNNREQGMGNMEDNGKRKENWQHLMYLNWQHLMYFLVAADTGNFTTAADQMFVTQSTLTKAMNNLEGTLGVPLFEKKGRNIRLTSYGENFYEDLKEITGRMSDSIHHLHDMIDLKSGNITISGSYTMCAEYLPHKIRKFRKDYPEIDFSIKYTGTSFILKQLIEGTTELGFCGDYDVNSKQYEMIERFKVKEEELIVIVPPQCRYSNAGEITDFSVFRKEPFIVNSRSNTGTNYVFNRMCEEAGFKPHIAFESNDDHTMIGMVASGLGIAVIANSPSLLVNKVTPLHFKHPPVKNQYMVYNRERDISPLVKSFIDFIRAECLSEKNT